MNNTQISNECPNVFPLTTFLSEDFRYEDIPIEVREGVYEIQQLWGNPPKGRLGNSILNSLAPLAFIIAFITCSYHLVFNSGDFDGSSLMNYINVIFLGVISAGLIAGFIAFLLDNISSIIATNVTSNKLITYHPGGRIAVWGRWSKKEFQDLRANISEKQKDIHGQQ